MGLESVCLMKTTGSIAIRLGLSSAFYHKFLAEHLLKYVHRMPPFRIHLG